MATSSSLTWLQKPYHNFFRIITSSGILLITTAIIALIWANSPWGATYHHFWDTDFTLRAGGFETAVSLHFIINEGLMAVFFLLVGLEIKREIRVGELSHARQALLPISAALGGMLVPAVIYLGLNPPGSEAVRGWAIPTVTDIAFSLGVLALLGTRAPLSMKIFLTALAIVDDLGAVLVIALFYTAGIQWEYLLPAIGLLCLMMFMNRIGVTKLRYYVLCGLLLWAVTLVSGVHTTVAGVLMALTVPSWSRIDPRRFRQESAEIVWDLQRVTRKGDGEIRFILVEQDYQSAVLQLEMLCERAQAPLLKMQHALEPWVNYGIMPLFALANAGILLDPEGVTAMLSSPLMIGILVGLLLGKPLGIIVFTWLPIRLGWADLPAGLSWREMVGLSWLGGIGFTMSIFITGLAFPNDPELVETAKTGIIAASIIAGLAGWLFLRPSGRNAEPESSGPPDSPDSKVPVGHSAH